MPDKTLRARRYRDADNIKPLSAQSKTNRVCVGATVVTWKSAAWRKLFHKADFSDDPIDVRVQDHSLALYENSQPIGVAEFRTFQSHCNTSLDDFENAADQVSSELYEFAHGLNETLTYLGAFCEFSRGMRVIEFKRLAMHPGHAAGSKWVIPINAFINTKFVEAAAAWNLALVLCPFPLEFEVGIDDRDLDEDREEKLNHRRRALVRHYQKTLGVELAVPETSSRWWMGRLL